MSFNMSDEAKKVIQEFILKSNKEIFDRWSSRFSLDEMTYKVIDVSSLFSKSVFDAAKTEDIISLFQNPFFQQVLSDYNNFSFMSRISPDILSEVIQIEEIYNLLVDRNAIVEVVKRCLEGKVSYDQSKIRHFLMSRKDSFVLDEQNVELFKLLEVSPNVDLDSLFVTNFSLFLKTIKELKKVLNITDSDLLKYINPSFDFNRLKDFIKLFDDKKLFFEKFKEYYKVNKISVSNLSNLFDLFAEEEQAELFWITYLNNDVTFEFSDKAKKFIDKNTFLSKRIMYSFDSFYVSIDDYLEKFEEYKKMKKDGKFGDKEKQNYFSDMRVFEILVEKGFLQIPDNKMIRVLNNLRVDKIRSIFKKYDVSYEKLLMIIRSERVISGSNEKSLFLKEELQRKYKEKYGYEMTDLSVIPAEREKVLITIFRSLLNKEENPIYKELLSSVNSFDFNLNVLKNLLGDDKLENFDIEMFESLLKKVIVNFSNDYSQKMDINYFNMFFLLFLKIELIKNDRASTLAFIGGKGEHEGGCFYPSINAIRISSDTIMDNMKSNIEVIETIFHELTHAVQRRRINNSEYDYEAFKWAKDNVLTEYVKDYYEDGKVGNYKVTTGEVEARINGYVECFRFLKTLGPDSTLAYEYFDKKKDEYLEDVYLIDKVERKDTLSGEKSNLFDLFDRLLTDEQRKKAVLSYPILLYEYDENGNKRSIVDLLDVFEKLVIERMELTDERTLLENARKIMFYIKLLNERFELDKKHISTLSPESDEVFLYKQSFSRFNSLLSNIDMESMVMKYQDYPLFEEAGLKAS